MPSAPPDVPHTFDYEYDGDPSVFNVWCSLCRAARGGLTAAEVEAWCDEHECDREEEDA